MPSGISTSSTEMSVGRSQAQESAVGEAIASSEDGMNEQNKWAFAFHRIKVAEENAKNSKPGPCNCPDCKQVMASLGMDYRGKDLVSA